MDVKLTVLVPEELRRQAKAIAAWKGVTVSDIVRQALEEFVDDARQELGLGSIGKPPAADEEQQDST